MQSAKVLNAPLSSQIDLAIWGGVCDIFPSSPTTESWELRVPFQQMPEQHDPLSE